MGASEVALRASLTMGSLNVSLGPATFSQPGGLWAKSEAGIAALSARVETDPASPHRRLEAKELYAAGSLGTKAFSQRFQNASSGDKNATSIPAQ